MSNDSVLPSNIIDIFSKPKVSDTIKVRERNDIEVTYTYCIRYNSGSEDDTVILDTNSFSYEEAIFAAAQLIEMDWKGGNPDGVTGDSNLIRLINCKVLDIELMEVHISYE